MRTLITFVSDYYPSNTGFSQAFQHLHNCILQCGECDKVLVFCFGEGKQTTSDKVEVYNIPKPKGQRLLAKTATRGFMQNRFKRELSGVFKRIDEEIRNNEVQMILLETMYMGWLIPILKNRYRDIPTVCRFHGTAPEYTAFYIDKKTTQYRHYLIDEIFKNTYIAVTTEFYISFFSEWFKDYKKFIDKEFFILPNTSKPLEASVTINNSNKISLLQLGRMDVLGYHQKGYQDSLKALMYLEESNPELCKRIKYITIGSGVKEDDFVKKSSCLTIVEHQHFSSLPNEEVKEIEMQADVILLPSRCEGMSMFATEVLAAGKPIIFTTGNGLDCLCRDNYNGLGFRYYDYLSMARNIERIVTDDGYRHMLSENSKSIYEKEYSYKAVASKYATITRYFGA